MKPEESKKEEPAEESSKKANSGSNNNGSPGATRTNSTELQLFKEPPPASLLSDINLPA